MSATTFASLLSNFMKDYPSGRISPAEIVDAPLLEALKGNVDRENFRGGRVEVLIQTQRGRNARGFGESDSEPTGNAAAFVKMLIPIKRVMAVASLTGQARTLAEGGDSSWGRLVDKSIIDMQDDFNYTLNLAAAGNGTGCIARVKSVAAFGSSSHVITCDNTYADSGIENTQLIQKDMYVSLWDVGTSAFVADSGGATEFRVTAVAPKKRTAGNAYAAEDGTFTISCASDLSGTIGDNDLVYLAGSKDQMPMGLGGIVANNNTGTYDDDFAAPFTTATFQNLTRASYPSLCADVWKATDFGLSSESPADGTPTLWDLSVISDAMSNVKSGSGKGKTNLLLCHSDLAMAINRLNKSESAISVNVTNTTGSNQAAVGSQYPKTFLTPDGREIPIVVCDTMPRYELIGLDTSVMKWHPLGDADFKRDYGDVWQPSRGNRRDEWDAPYQWYYELSSERCDVHFRIQDLRVDV